MERLKAIVVNGAIIAFVAVLLMWGNTWNRQRIHFNKGEAAVRAGDYIAAIADYEAAVHMYTPGSGMVEKAAEQLWAIGETMERAGDPVRALIAYRSLRSSFYAVRGLTAPGKEWIARCDDKIGRLVKAQGNIKP